jgi:2-hydroxychromene-2-carboxylate isomerase
MTILKIYFDFKSPESYLAFHQTQKISLPDSTQIEWKPFLTKNKKIPLTKEFETKGETHIRIREEHKKFVNLKYSKILNVPMLYPEENIQTDLALAVTSLFKKETETYMTLAFDCYWRENLNLNNQEVLENILAKTSLDINLLDNPNSMIDMLKGDTAIAKDQGVISTPTYQIGEELFLGREHLPWIQKILEDQS